MIALRLNDHMVLREASADDADELFALVERNRAYLGQWLGWVAAITSVDDERAFLRLTNLGWRDRTELSLVLVLNERIIGSVGLPHIDPDAKTAEIGYWLDQAAQGHGYATAAVRTLHEFVWSALDCDRVEIHAAVGNAPSRAVAERLGYRLDRIEPDAIISGIDARIDDAAIYVLERGQAPSRRPSAG